MNAIIVSGMSKLNNQYPNWEKNSFDKPPICIPEASDVCFQSELMRTIDPDAIDYDKSFATKRITNTDGNDAEKLVHRAFQCSKIGGILFHQTDMRTLFNKLNPTANKLKIEEEYMFEIDFLYFHPEIGLVQLECKSRKNITESFEKKTLNQAQMTEAKLKVFLENRQLTDLVEDAQVMLCFPNGLQTGQGSQQCENIIQQDSETIELQVINRDNLEKCAILDKTILSNTLKFECFWKKQREIANAKHTDKNFFKDPKVRDLIAIMFGIRSDKFVFMTNNVIAVREMIASHISVQHLAKKVDDKDEQQPNRKRVIKINGQKKIMYLNSDQWKACEAFANEVNKNLILFGPPGSGKTLLIMLLAKKAAETKKTGRVLVFVPSNTLAKLYVKFFNENCTERKRDIVINPSKAEIRQAAKINSFDDIFADEVFTGSWLPTDRGENCAAVLGITIGRFSDRKSLLNVKSIICERHFGRGTTIFADLNTVMRNTRNIFDYYNVIQAHSTEPNRNYQKCLTLTHCCKPQSKFPDDRSPVGHNIQGRTVEVFKQTLAEVNETIAERIKNLFCVKSSSPAPTAIHSGRGSSIVSVMYRADETEEANSFSETASTSAQTAPTQSSSKLRHSDIAIIVAHEPVNEQIKLIKDFLQTKGIFTGSIHEQATMENESMVIIDSSANVLSFEWCVVFVIDASNCFYSKRLAYPIVPLSRAISSLVVFKTVECGVKDDQPQNHFWQCDHLRWIVRTSLSRKTKITSHHRLEGALLKSWQWSYELAVWIRNICALFALLLVAGSVIWLNDFDFLFTTVVILLFLINLFLNIEVILITCFQFGKGDKKMWRVIQFLTKALAFSAVFIGIINMTIECRNYPKFLSVYWATFFVVFVVAVANFFFRLDLFAFVTSENRRNFRWYGTFRSSLIAILVCFISIIPVLLAANFFLSLSLGFRFALIATLSLGFPILFLLLMQDDVKSLERIDPFYVPTV